MVATVLRLRYRILGNTLARRPWQLVGFCFGILWAIGILTSVIAGLVAVVVFQGLEAARATVVIGGSALVLGRVLGPVSASSSACSRASSPPDSSRRCPAVSAATAEAASSWARSCSSC
ncbi:hypothetical protein Mlaev_00776 [Microbacterium laevaniformans]|uniref:Uncharacterized protein n=1 Tax=Microbacterium laevaniformans TaxID=36807 RepID=A0A150HGA0_9MICO|nr:hypothetical protein [Microbacterium laevaniformans]KXZ61136.1 hypothetical protein Mlaev_00776 [Microbacterium laevaniformans]